MTRKPFTLVLCAFLALLPSVLVLSSNLVPFMLCVAALVAVPAARMEGLPLPWPRGSLVWICLLFALWAALACVWSFDLEEALLRALRLAVVALAGGLVIGIAARLPAEERAEAARWLCIGFALGLVIFVAERLTGNALHLLVAEPEPERGFLSVLNRGATGLALLVLPVTAVLYRGSTGRWALLLPLIMLGLLFFYVSQAAILGAAVGLVFLLLMLLSARLTTVLAGIVIVVGLLAAPAIAELMAVPELFRSGWINYTGQHRLHIWDFVAERIFERPVFGWGFDAAEHMRQMGAEEFLEAREQAFSTHPHNAALQIWLELGLVGTLLMAALLLAVLRLVERLGEIDRAAATALIVSCLAIASVSYGLWQTKWLATIIALPLVVVATRGPGSRA